MDFEKKNITYICFPVERKKLRQCPRLIIFKNFSSGLDYYLFFFFFVIKDKRSF